jgi:hypothetical protein
LAGFAIDRDHGRVTALESPITRIFTMLNLLGRRGKCIVMTR